jgi:hypothetical protein
LVLFIVQNFCAILFLECALILAHDVYGPWSTGVYGCLRSTGVYGLRRRSTVSLATPPDAAEKFLFCASLHSDFFAAILSCGALIAFLLIALARWLLIMLLILDLARGAVIIAIVFVMPGSGAPHRDAAPNDEPECAAVCPFPVIGRDCVLLMPASPPASRFVERRPGTPRRVTSPASLPTVVLSLAVLFGFWFFFWFFCLRKVFSENEKLVQNKGAA